MYCTAIDNRTRRPFSIWGSGRAPILRAGEGGGAARLPFAATRAKGGVSAVLGRPRKIILDSAVVGDSIFVAGGSEGFTMSAARIGPAPSLRRAASSPAPSIHPATYVIVRRPSALPAGHGEREINRFDQAWRRA